MAELLTRRQAAALVIVVDSRPQRPVYKRGRWIGDNAYAACGCSIGFFDAWLPRRLAVKFARPCRRCYPRFEQLELVNG